MDRNDVLYLISTIYTPDEIGRQIPAEQRQKVYCAVRSISAAEFARAGQLGLNPERKFLLFAYDYRGQEIVEYHGARYSVYRTYLAENELMELYCERKAGDA